MEQVTNTDAESGHHPSAYDGKNYTFLSNRGGVHNRYIAYLDSAISTKLVRSTRVPLGTPLVDIWLELILPLTARRWRHQSDANKGIAAYDVLETGKERQRINDSICKSTFRYDRTHSASVKNTASPPSPPFKTSISYKPLNGHPKELSRITVALYGAFCFTRAGLGVCSGEDATSPRPELARRLFAPRGTAVVCTYRASYLPARP